jgi:hypothetical protein
VLGDCRNGSYGTLIDAGTIIIIVLGAITAGIAAVVLVVLRWWR